MPLEPKIPTQEPLYVVKTDIKKNIVVVGEEKDLYSKESVAGNINWIDNKFKVQNLKLSCLARIRYGHPKENCTIQPKANSQLKVFFKKPQRAITPGQSVVFYQGEQVLGGGIIKC